MRRECRDCVARNRELAIPSCITPRAWRVWWCMLGSLTRGGSFEVGGGENVPDIPGACATHNFTYLVRGPLPACNGFIMSYPQNHMWLDVMTSSNGNIFRVTGSLCGEFTGQRQKDCLHASRCKTAAHTYWLSERGCRHMSVIASESIYNSAVCTIICLG